MKIKKKERQFIFPIFLCVLSFLLINTNEFLNHAGFSYWSSLIIKQPYRVITYCFVHRDIDHLLSNLFGIVVVRYSFLKMNLDNKYLFFYLVIFLIPIKTIILLILDTVFAYNYNHMLIGFSGVLFGTYTFILMSSIYGKRFFLNISISLEKNNEIKNLMILILFIGIIYSLMPSISLSGHLAGALSGFIIFFL